MACSVIQKDRATDITLIISTLEGTDVNGQIQKDSLNWLLESDSLHVCPESDNVVQRYASAVVNNILLQNDENITLGDECSWDGLVCDDEFNIIGVNVKTPGKLMSQKLHICLKVIHL